MPTPTIDAPTVRRTRLLRMLWLAGAAAVLEVACRKEAPPAGDTVEPPIADAGAPPEPADASRPSHDLETRGAARDGGALHPACEGKSLALFAAVLDERCTAPEADYDRLVAAGREKVDGGSPSIKQEARAEGGRLVFALVNGSKTAQTIPVRVGLSQGGAFSVLADDGRGFVYELASPKLDADVARATETLLKRTLHDRLRTGSGHDLPPTGEDGGPPTRVHTSAIRLLPAGRATVRMTVDPTIVARLGPKGPLPPCVGDASAGDASTCTLPKGHYTLYIGQTLSEIEAGPPAQAGWDAP